MPGQQTGPGFGGTLMPENVNFRNTVLAGGKPTVLDFIFLPWCSLFIILMLILAAAGATNILVWLPFVILMGASTGFFVLSYRKSKTNEATLAALCMAACILGIIVGGVGHASFLKEYKQMGDGASYWNVLPSESASGKLDAATIQFSNGTKVDTTRTYGYADGQGGSGKTFCVAPVSNGDPASEKRVEYWVAGTNCCNQRGYFDCGESSTDGARGAVVYGKGQHAEEGFKKAVDAATHAYGVETGEDYLLVRWVTSPTDWRGNLMNSVLALFWAFIGVHLVLSCILGCAIDRTMKPK